MASIPIVLDCDPGHDDALAIVLALARPELRLMAITTVAGNASLERTTRNALRVLTLLGRTEVPVAAGADRPIVRDPWVCRLRVGRVPRLELVERPRWKPTFVLCGLEALRVQA